MINRSSGRQNQVKQNRNCLSRYTTTYFNPISLKMPIQPAKLHQSSVSPSVSTSSQHVFVRKCQPEASSRRRRRRCHPGQAGARPPSGIGPDDSGDCGAHLPVFARASGRRAALGLRPVEGAHRRIFAADESSLDQVPER